MFLAAIVSSLILMLVFLAFSFLFSGFETGFISVNLVALEQDARKDRTKDLLLKQLKEPDKLLSTTLIGNNIANVVLASLATFFAHQLNYVYFPPQYTALAIGLVVLLIGEILPKALFRDHADKLVPAVLPILMFFYYLFKPLVASVSVINARMRSALNIDEDGHFHSLSKEDLSFLLSQATGDAITQPQIDMIEDALEFREQE
ncbi:MAG: DUF21 domain-containing protein, partial [Candidatus Cloacimonetes bacterium]|nr:DUF21 domain-containing protein [Candidatus Cloacimonadota bacterium]